MSQGPRDGIVVIWILLLGLPPSAAAQGEPDEPFLARRAAPVVDRAALRRPVHTRKVLVAATRYLGANWLAGVKFGDMRLNLKGRLTGNHRYAVSVYGDFQLPTHNWSDCSDGGLVWRFGAVASVLLRKLRAGAGISMLLIMEMEPPIGLGVEAYWGYKVLGLLVLQTAVQAQVSEKAVFLSFLPGVELELSHLRLGLCTRINVTDDAYRFYNGWATLQFHVGMAW